MEFEWENSRIFNFVLALGLAIIFLAILMIFLGSNAQADVIVDQAGGGNYLTIQEGIDNAIPGENITVWDGSYNENITIDKSVHLIGNGSATTFLDASGLNNNAVNITAEGVEITGLNITNTGADYGIWSSVGGFNIHHNIFNTQGWWTISMDIDQVNSGSTTVGDIIVENNEVLGTGGFSFNIWYESPLPGSNLVFGKTVIANNTLHNTQTGIAIDRYTVFSMDQGSITWGDIMVKDNFINSSISEGIFFWGIFYNITDVSINIGEMDFSNNNITAQSNGIYIDWWDFCDGIYGNTIATTQDTYVNNNDIVSQSGYGLMMQTDIIGNIIYDSTSITTGDFYIYSNNITSESAAPGHAGIHFYMSEIAQEMYNDSSVNFGNISVDTNNVDANSRGIYLNIVNSFGSESYDNALVNIGDVSITNNDILSTNEGVYISFNNLGSVMHDQASATLGNFIINNNNLSSGGNGINIDMDQLGFDMHNSASFAMGYFTMISNNITSVGQGINIQGKNIARTMHNDTIFTKGDFTVNNNNINSTSSTITLYIQSSAYNMTGNATAIFGNSYFNDNVINSTDWGIDLNLIDFAFIMEGNSYFEMGSLEIMRNSIVSNGLNGFGIYFNEMGFLGNYLSDTSIAVFGDFIVEDNTINASRNGVNVNAYDWGETLSGNASVTFGDFSVSNNIIESGNQGINFQFDPAGYDMLDMSTFAMGSIRISNNTILSGIDPASVNSYGILIWTQSVGYDMHHESQAIIGSILINDNDITVLFGTNTDGINIYRIANYGYLMYDRATFTMNGNIEVCRNTVNTTNGDNGIYCDVYENGYYLYDDSTAYFGNFLFNENTISSGRNGIYINSFQMCGSYVYNNSVASFGDIDINGNQIIAGSIPSGTNRGIYFYFYENGYDIFGNCQIYFGHVQLNDNTITCYDSHGIYVDAFYEIGANYMQDNAYFEMGNFEIQRNWIDANESGIYIWELAFLGYEIYDNSTAVFGDFLFDGNTINASEDGIYINAHDWGYTMTGTSSATFGDLSVSNNIIESGYQGIYCQFENAGCNIHDRTQFEMGALRVSNNTIISGQDPASVDSYGICFRTRWVGYNMHNESQAIVGPILVNDNTLTVVFGTNSHAIYINWISDYGANMYDTATFTMNGNIEVCRNTVNTTDGDEGILCDVYNLGNYLYGDNIASYGDFLFNDNIIIDAYNDGMYILVNAIGYYTYGNSSVTIGNVELNNNDIQIVDGSYYSSIYLELYDLGTSMYDGSIFNMGHVQMNDNIIYNPDGMGLYIEAYRLGYEMYNSSSANFGNFEFLRNNITSYDEGINLWYFQNFAAYMYNNTSAFFGDFLINDNIINTTAVGADGIYIEQFQYLGYQMNDQSYAEFGNFECSGNEVNASSGAYGIYIWPDSWAYNMYNNATFMMGDWLINNNTAISEREGIFFYSMGFGNLMYGNSSAHIGKNEIMYNTVNSSNDNGIESFWWYEFGSWMYDYSYFEVGSCYIMFNNITSTSSTYYGLETGPQSTGYFVRDEAEAYFGDYIISNNVIYSEGPEGIDLWYYQVGYWLDNSNLPESRAVVEIGMVMVTDNVITVPNGKGIYVYGYDVAYSVNDYSSVTTGGIYINRNTINSYDHGIDIYMYELGEGTSNNAQVWLGSFVIDDNEITATNGNGIYIYSEFFAYSTSDSAFVHMDDFYFTNNDIVAGITGIELTYQWWIELYTSSEARAPGLWVSGNNVSAPVSALNYTTLNTPTRIDPGTTFSSGNVTISDNIFDGGLFGVMIDWRDMLPSGEGQPDFYFENNSIENGVANSIGLYMMNIQNATIESLYLDSYDQGIYVSNSNIWYMFNSTISNIPSYDLNLSSGSFIGAVNTTFDNASVYFEDYDCLLHVGWFMNVYVQSQVSLPVPEANLTVKDVDGTDIFNSTTGLDGRAFYLICWEYQENITGIIKNFNDYTADANKAGSFGSAVPNPTMNQTRLVVITLLDFIPPTIFSDGSDTAGTTGDPFYFEINASDNMGIVSVHVNYRFDGMGPYLNRTMNGTGPYWRNEIMPSDYVGFIEYYFSAVDSGGFWVNTTPTTAPITDNDPPTIISDNSDTIATTGEIFNFLVDAIDNINMSEVHVVWWFGAGAPTTDTMIGTGPYTFWIPVPSNSLDQLHYYFTMNDTAGNWLIGPQVDINVIDNDPPIYTWVLQPSEGTTGESVLVSILATDNIDITYYKIDIDGVLYDLIKDGDYYNFTINIPPDSLTDITYSVIINDTANNPNSTVPTVISVRDNDQPTYSWVSQPFSGTTGESVLVSILATDNIGITYYKIDIDGTLYDLIKDGDYYNYTINIPSDSAADITYSIILNDSENNSNIITPPMIIVTDNDQPTYSWVSQPISGTTGESVLVSILATDNIGITYNKIEIDGILYDLIKDGDYYNYTINIPLNSTASITYRLIINDSANNSNIIPDTMIVVTDNDAPTYNWVSRPTGGLVGSSVLVSLNAYDNIGIINYTIYIDGVPFDLVKDGDYYNYTIDIPPGPPVDIIYNVTFRDAAGHLVETVDTVIGVLSVDVDAPEYSWILHPTSGTTGESILVSLLATDNIGIIYYKIEIDGVFYDLIKNGDYYNYTITIPTDSLASITYNVVFNDSANNPNSTAPTVITITDNDDPNYNWILHPSTGIAGESVLISLRALDNIGVTYYKIEIDGILYDLVQEGNFYNYTIDLPPGSSASITYDIIFKDAADNEMATGDTVITVTIPVDVESPDFDWILHPDVGATGDSLLVSLLAMDNIGITYYKISVDGILYDLVKDGDYYNYTITIPTDSVASITYFVVFNDSANNPSIETDTVITVTDNDPGTISNPASDTSGQKGKEFHFQIDASDNIGISEVKVWYWFGDDDSQKKFLTLMESNGTFSGSFNPDESGTLHYYFEVTDDTGNTFESSDNTIDIASEPEEETNILPWILLVILIVVIILFFFLMRKRKEPEEVVEAEPEEELEEGELEEGAEELEEEAEFEEMEPSEEIEPEEKLGEEGIEEEEIELEEFEVEPEELKEETEFEEIEPEEELEAEPEKGLEEETEFEEIEPEEKLEGEPEEDLEKEE